MARVEALAGMERGMEGAMVMDLVEGWEMEERVVLAGEGRGCLGKQSARVLGGGGVGWVRIRHVSINGKLTIIQGQGVNQVTMRMSIIYVDVLQLLLTQDMHMQLMQRSWCSALKT